MSGEIVKVSAVIIVSAVLIIALRNRLGEYSFILALSTVVIVLLLILDNLFGVIGDLEDLFEQSGNVSVYFTTALKALGISYITAFSADMCRDYGLSALAQASEITGKISIFILSIPLMNSVLDTAISFVGK